MIFSSNPNQRRITYHKIEGTAGYTKINIQAAQDAMKNLSYSAYMLYSYMALNANNYEDWFSPAILLQKTSCTESTYRKAFAELLEKGYLVPDENWKSHFTFYEGGAPHADKEHNRSRKTETGVPKNTPRKKQDGVSKNNTENIENIVEPPALEERSAYENTVNTYFIQF